MRHSRLHRGLKADLPSSLSYGEVYFCTDTLQVYLGLANNSVVEVRDKQVLQEISNIKGDITSKNNDLISKINALTTTVNNNKSDGDNKHNALAQTVADNKTAIDNKVNDLTGVVNANKSAIEHTVSELTGTVNANKTDANNKINALTGTVNANKSDADNKHNSLTQTVTDNREYGERTYVKRADYLNGDIDFNNVTTPGMYYVIGGNHANKPPTLANGKGGMLIVSSYATNTKGIIQTFTDEVHGVTSTRVLPYGASTWGSWNTHYSVNSKPTPNDLGARPASWVPSWNDVTGKPSTFPPSSHNHDSAYLGKTATATNSDKLFGYGQYTGRTQRGSFGIPVVGSDGVMEIGQYLDFHLGNNNNDYDARLQMSGDTQSLVFNDKKVLLKGQAVPSDIDTYSKSEIDNKDTATLNSAKQYANETFISKAPKRYDSVDLNTLTNPGHYVCGMCKNAPTNYGRMEVLVWNDYATKKWVTQIFYADISNLVYTRCTTTEDASQWTSWSCIYSTNHKPTPSDIGAVNVNDTWKHKIKLLDPNTDLNTLYANGFYTADSDGNSKTIVNRPPGDTGFTLHVMTVWGSEAVSGRQIQVAYMIYTNEIYIRHKPENSSWSSWVGFSNYNHTHDNLYLGKTAKAESAKVADSVAWNNVSGRPTELKDFGAEITNSSDINTTNSDKVWGLRSGSTTPNRPRDWVTIMNLGVVGGNSNGQLAWNYDGAELDLRFRNRHDTDGNYGAWRQIYHTGFKPSWNDIQGKPSTFTPSSHDHPYLAWGNNLIDCRQPNDFAGLAKPNNVNIETWYGFSITNRCASDIPAGGVAFSVNARNGMVWAKGDIYARGDQRVYHTGFKPSPSDIGASPSNHNHNGTYLKQVVGATNESYVLDKKFIEIGDSSTKVHVGRGSTDVYIQNTVSNKYFALKDDGRVLYNNINVTLDDPNTVLWRGYHHMIKSETVTPSKPLNHCSRGWVLVWSDWDDGGTGNNFNINYSYIPKNTMFNTGNNTCFALSCGESSNTFANKTLYIFNDRITGHDSNKDKANNPNSYDIVLRAVLEY